MAVFQGVVSHNGLQRSGNLYNRVSDLLYLNWYQVAQGASGSGTYCV